MIRQLVLVAASLSLCLGGTACAAVGDVDPSFNGFGSALFDNSRLAFVQAIRELPDERLILAGWTNYTSTNKGSVARLLADGEPDSAFGAFGVSTTVVGSGSRFYDVLADPDGGAIAVGWTYNPSWTWLLQRFSSTGALDPTFGTGGTTKTTIDGADRAWQIMRQGDGSLIVVGDACMPSNPACDVVIGRYTANGILDPTFGTGGIVRTSLHASGYEAGPNSSLVLQPDGKLLIGIGGRLLRVLSDGSPDATFGSGGVAVVPNGSVNDVALLPDGRILVALENLIDIRYGVARFLADGTLDVSFGTEGFANAGLQALAVESDGSFVTTDNSAPCVVGSEDSAYYCGMPIFRNRPDGSVDTTFGPGGTGFGAAGAERATGHTALVRANGGLLIGGGSSSRGGAVTQWSPDGCLQAITPKLGYSGLSSAKWAVKASGTLQIPGLTSVDPATDGVRVRFRGGDFGQLALGGFTIPGGTGWSTNSANTKWKYKGPKTGAPGGVTALKLTKKAGDPVPIKFSVKTKNHYYYADSNYYPLRFEVIFDYAAPTSVECSAGSFFLGQCEEKLDGDGLTTGDSCKD